jgi:Ca2+/Na+ antiporter
MDQAALIAVDLLAIGILTFGLYFRRHHRRDLVVAFLGVNVGVLAVSLMLGSTTVGAGLGLGLFGVLSIIRLRSDEIAQHEVAYYFSALAIGLISGLAGTVTVLSIALVALILAVMFVGDSTRLFRRYRQQTIMVDRAFADERELTAHLARLLAARIRQVQIKHLDLVNDTTLVDVRFEVVADAAESRATGRPSGRTEASTGIRTATERERERDTLLEQTR